jgi:hypothetical protein
VASSHFKDAAVLAPRYTLKNPSAGVVAVEFNIIELSATLKLGTEYLFAIFTFLI